MILCSEVHPRRKENNPRVESSVLKKLEKLLPTDSKPILISDAGFRGPWLRKVVAKGWDFVGRVRGRVRVRMEGGEKKWVPVKQLWGQATRTARNLGLYSFAKYLPFEARVVVIWENKRKRHKALPSVGRRSRKAIRAAREPWVSHLVEERGVGGRNRPLVQITNANRVDLSRPEVPAIRPRA